MKITPQGHAFVLQGAKCQVLFSFLCLNPINAIKNVSSSVLSVDEPTFPEVHHGIDTLSPRPSSLPQGQNRKQQILCRNLIYILDRLCTI